MCQQFQGAEGAGWNIGTELEQFLESGVAQLQEVLFGRRHVLALLPNPRLLPLRCHDHFQAAQLSQQFPALRGFHQGGKGSCEIGNAEDLHSGGPQGKPLKHRRHRGGRSLHQRSPLVVVARGYKPAQQEGLQGEVAMLVRQEGTGRSGHREASHPSDSGLGVRLEVVFGPAVVGGR